jgi:fructokinase
VKLGEKGSLVKRHGKVHAIDPHPVVMVNTNGAGDMYAAGFLHGLAQGHDTEVVGSVASEVAGLVVSSEGARMHVSHHGKIENILKKYKRHDDA